MRRGATGGPYDQLPELFTVSPGQAGWAEPQFAKGVGYLGRYAAIGGVDGVTGDVTVSHYDYATDTVEVAVMHAALGGEGTADMHDNPGLCIRNDGRLIAMYTRHADSTIRYRVTTDPLSVNPMPATADWEAEETIAVPNTHKYDYPAVMYIGSSLRLFVRDIPTGGTDAHLKYMDSSDDGDTWPTTLTDLYNNPTKTAYWSVAPNRTRSEIAILTFNDNEDAVTNNTLYLIRMTESGLFQADGDPIVASLPLAPADLDAISSTGGHHLHCVEYDPDGRVGFVCARRVSGVHQVIRGIFDTSWTIEQITGAVSSGEYSWGNVIDPDDFDRAWVVLWNGSQGSGGHASLYLADKSSGSWTLTLMGTGSGSGDWFWPIFLRPAVPGVVAFVMYGHYGPTSPGYTHFGGDIVAIRH